MAHHQGGHLGFSGPSPGGGWPAVVAAGATAVPCHCRSWLAAVGHHGAQDRCPTLQLPEAEKKKDIKRAYKKMTAEEKNDLMQKLAELDAEDANDDESAPPSLAPR
jgi:hypothetical protein